MRVAIVAETFLPLMNGVTHSVMRVVDHLQDRRDDVIIIAPDSGKETPDSYRSVPIYLVPSVSLPKYPGVRVAPGGVRRIEAILSNFQPDIVHVASPFVLGWRGVLAAARLGVPTVAAYQTSVPAYARRYGLPAAETILWQHVERIHRDTTLTLAPSATTIDELEEHGIERIRLWVRGVDAERFSPERRSELWRSQYAQPGQKIIGYVGRLAIEKQVEDLRALSEIPDTRLVIVGDGPLRTVLEKQLPEAHFTGFLGGTDLATAMASMDVFVHPGESETFCQTIQEAMASGVPVVATGAGGPIDLVDQSRTGWLYPPGDLTKMREHVQDLVGDDAKRAAFGLSARGYALGRTWKSVTNALIGHYSDAIELNKTLDVPARAWWQLFSNS